MARLDRDGRLDTRFNAPNGYRAQLVSAATAQGGAIAVDARGRVTVAGSVRRDAEVGSEELAAFWRFGHDGSIDREFGDAGRLELQSLGMGRVRELVVDARRRPLALGTRWQQSEFSIFVAKLAE